MVISHTQVQFQIGDGRVAIQVPLICKLGGGWFAIHLECVDKLSFISNRRWLCSYTGTADI